MLHTSYNVGTFGSGSGWIHIQIDAWIRIRIRHTDLDPDPESEIELKKSTFSQIFHDLREKIWIQIQIRRIRTRI